MGIAQSSSDEMRISSWFLQAGSLLRIGFALRIHDTSYLLAGRFCVMDFIDKELNLNLAVIDCDCFRGLLPF